MSMVRRPYVGSRLSSSGAGRLLAEISLPANASGAAITYIAGGKQYVAFPVGGSSLAEELIALALPRVLETARSRCPLSRARAGSSATVALSRRPPLPGAP